MAKSPHLSVEYLDPKNPKNSAQLKQFFENNPKAYIQQTPFWAKIISSCGKDIPIFIVAKKNNTIVGVLPIFIFKGQQGTIINSVPYPGPLGGVVINPQIVKRNIIFSTLLNAVDEFAQKNNILLATIISSPFIPDHNLYRRYWKPDWEFENYTLFIDLTETIQFKYRARNRRRMLNKGRENGFNVEACKTKKDFESWYKIHIKRHKSLGLEPLPKKLLERFFSYLVKKNQGRFFVVKNRSQKVVAGCFIGFHKDILDIYIMSGDLSAYQQGAVFILVEYLLEWAKENKFKIFNWQSSKPRGGGPYNFKMQWGSQEKPYYFFTKQYGNITPLISKGLNWVKKEYKWHYVLPYSVFD